MDVALRNLTRRACLVLQRLAVLRPLAAGLLVAGVVGLSVAPAWAESTPPTPDSSHLPQHRDSLPYRPDAIPIEQYSPLSMAQRFVTDPRSRAQDRFLAIYSGSTAGVYYQIASALCAVMERTFDQHGIRCAPLRSSGVAGNAQLMREGRAQIIIVQSDTNYFAQQGTRAIPGGRSLLSLHDEMGVMVVRKDSDIKSPADLAGKRINLGPAGSASNALWQEYLTALGIDEGDLDRVYAIPQDLNRAALCDGSIDAFGLWIGHPAPVIDTVLNSCEARLVGMWDDRLAPMITAHKYYFRQVLPAGTYAGQTEPLEGYGIKASLVGYERLEDDLAYWLVRMVAENLVYFRSRHPALAHMQLDEMFGAANFLPFHRGAEKYWQEAGRLAPEQQ